MFRRSISATLASPIAQPTHARLDLARRASARSSGAHLLGVVEPLSIERAVEHHDGSDHGAGQRSAADLVGAGDEAVAVRAGRILVAVQPHEPALRVARIRGVS